jgi:hypothetical protein
MFRTFFKAAGNAVVLFAQDTAEVASPRWSIY